MIKSVKSFFIGLWHNLKEPGHLCECFWQYFYSTLKNESFFILLLMVCSFIPYVALFAAYKQYEFIAGGLFKPFADIIITAMIVHALPKNFAGYLKSVLLFLSGILSLMELFVVEKYATFLTAGIVNVIIGTNFNESKEFVKMYFSWEYMLFIFFAGICVYILYRCCQKFKLPKFALLLLPFLFMYSLFYTVIPGKNITECLTVTRLANPTVQAVEDLIEFKKIYSDMNNKVEITENKSDIPNIVFILGEATTRNHMSLYGYRLPTTPKLDEMAKNDEIYVFKDVISPHAYTIGSLREVFTFHHYESTNKWYENANIFDIANMAGYKTYWLSNQESSGQWANVALAYANRCDYHEFTGARQSYEQSFRPDGELLPMLYKYMDNNNEKNFYVLHLMGGHGDYKNRYTPDFAKFKPIDETRNSASQNEYRAEYDNAMLYNDTIVTQIMTAFKDKNAIVIYMPDHGEEVYDTGNLKGHSDDNATRFMLEIPFIIYTTPSFREKYPQLDARIKNAVDRPYMTDDLIHTMLDIMSIETPEYEPTRSIINENYNVRRKRMFLDKDYDESMKNTPERN